MMVQNVKDQTYMKFKNKLKKNKINIKTNNLNFQSWVAFGEQKSFLTKNNVLNILERTSKSSVNKIKALTLKLRVYGKEKTGTFMLLSLLNNHFPTLKFLMTLSIWFMERTKKSNSDLFKKV